MSGLARSARVLLLPHLLKNGTSTLKMPHLEPSFQSQESVQNGVPLFHVLTS